MLAGRRWGGGVRGPRQDSSRQGKEAGGGGWGGGRSTTPRVRRMGRRPLSESGHAGTARGPGSGYRYEPLPLPHLLFSFPLFHALIFPLLALLFFLRLRVAFLLSSPFSSFSYSLASFSSVLHLLLILFPASVPQSLAISDGNRNKQELLHTEMKIHRRALLTFDSKGTASSKGGRLLKINSLTWMEEGGGGEGGPGGHKDRGSRPGSLLILPSLGGTLKDLSSVTAHFGIRSIRFRLKPFWIPSQALFLLFFS